MCLSCASLGNDSPSLSWSRCPILRTSRTHFPPSSERRGLAAAYGSYRELRQPEKLFPDQIRQWPNIDRWKAVFTGARARSPEGPSFSSSSRRSTAAIWRIVWQPRNKDLRSIRGDLPPRNFGDKSNNALSVFRKELNLGRVSRHHESGDITIRKSQKIASQFCKWQCEE